jgi:hypothetical protein
MQVVPNFNKGGGCTPAMAIHSVTNDKTLFYARLQGDVPRGMNAKFEGTPV